MFTSGSNKITFSEKCSIKKDPRLITNLKHGEGEKRKELSKKCGQMGNEVRGDLIAFVGKHRLKNVAKIAKRL
jgi:hypothetical protein